MQCAEFLVSPARELISLLSIVPGNLEVFVIGIATLLDSLTVQRL